MNRDLLKGRLLCRVPPTLPELEGDALPEWLHLVPWGRFEGHHSGNLIDVGPDEAAEVLANHAANGIDIVVDFEHQTIFTMMNGQPAPAQAWIDQLEVREDSGVWGHVKEWTAAGESHVRAREYRYLSPVLEQRRDPKTGDRTGLFVSSVALTNVPFFAGELQPVAARSHPENTMDLRLALIALLALPEAATDEDIVKATEELKTEADKSAEPDPVMLAKAELGDLACSTLKLTPTDKGAKAAVTCALSHEGFVPVAEHLKALHAAEAKAANATTDQVIARAVEMGKLTPSMVTHAKAWMVQNRTACTAWIDTLPIIVNTGDPSGRRGPKAPKEAYELTPEDQAVCKALNITEAQFRSSRKGAYKAAGGDA